MAYSIEEMTGINSKGYAMFYPRTSIKNAPCDIQELLYAANSYEGLTLHSMALTMIIRETSPFIRDPRFVPEAIRVLKALQAEGHDIHEMIAARMELLESAYTAMLPKVATIAEHTAA